MNEHEIGREVQELGSRLERIEASLGIKPGCGCVDGDRGASRHHESSGGIAQTKPVEWRLKKGDHLPPFLTSLMRLPLHPVSTFDSPPQSKTWSASPEPLILIVNWSGGGSDEFFRLVNQTFSVVKWTNPNTGVESANVTYAATRIASGRARTLPGQSGANFQLIVRAPGGTPIGVFNDPFSVNCNENDLFLISHQIDPGLYDLVTGVSWNLSYSGIARC
jgi:hypothetical protein